MSVAISQLDNMEHVESLRRIAQTFLIEWRRAHGRPGDSPQAELGNHGLTVTINNALTAAEQKLLRKPAGRQLVQRYVSHLVDQVYPQLADSIERQLHCHVSHWMVGCRA